MIGLPVDVNNFTFTENGEVFITTKKLPGLINDWQRRADSMSAEQQGNEVLRIDEFLRNSHTYFTVCIDDDPSYIDRPQPSAPLLSPEVRLSISILYTTLCLAKRHILPSSSFLPPGFHNRLIKNRLLDAGWCLSDIELLSTDKDNHFILEGYYSTLLGDRRNRKKHDKCNAWRCYAFDTEDSTYQVKHLQTCRGCDFIETGYSQLQHIYRDVRPETANGPIPLLQITESHGTYHINVTESTVNSSYVAFSHVFGDGLGNPKRCALPTCQLLRLQKRVDVLLGSPTEHGHGLFWLDSLCVPQQQCYDKVKQVALLRMKKTYLDAALVLVLNAELEGTSINSPPEELLMRIATNSWFRRLWTLQEGFLARNLRFQFSDGTLNPDDLIRSLQTTNAQFSIEDRLLSSALLPLQRLAAFRAGHHPTDDVTFVIFRLTAPADRPPIPVPLPAQH
jgi:hypothetical protein